MTDDTDRRVEDDPDYVDPLPDKPPASDVPQRDESPKTDEVPE